MSTPSEAVADFVASVATPAHPYYPPGVVVPNFLPNTLDTISILAIFFPTIAAVLVPYLIWAKRARPEASNGEIFTALWFLMCGVIHIGLEGYFVVNHATIASKSATLAQLWKEYSLSDSRYLTSDPFLVSMEAVTAFAWGPICLFLAYGVLDPGCPIRHPLQFLVSAGQLYGCILYYAIVELSDGAGIPYSRPEACYYWGYYFAFNAPWVIVPTLLLLQSFGVMTVACAKQIEAEKATKKKTKQQKK